jgi:nitroreductase
MNAVIDTIVQRRSVRFFKPDALPRDALNEILRAAQSAASGAGTQLWRFVVVDDAAFRTKLAALALPRYQKWMERAPGFLKDVRQQIDAVVKDPIYYNAPAVVFVIGSGMTADFDCSMVCGNMMVAAKSLGIGSCWVYFGQLPVKEPEVSAALELKDGEKVYGPILLGYPQEGLPPAAPRKAPIVKWISAG